ncbi:MAG: alcohol dehydrogenase catalytic domain-containing protein [bacterium]
MKALVFDGKLRMADLPEPAPREGEALIRVRMAGICNTDIEIVRGYMAFEGVPGHEFVGEVAALPPAAPDENLIGKRVVGEINASCGECEWCRAGNERHCPNRDVLGIFRRDGAFAEKLTLPVKNLHVVPDSLPDEVAVFTEPVAACYEILVQVDIKPYDRVAVIGDGKLGILAAQVLKSETEHLTVIGKHDKKLAILKDKFSIRAIRESELGNETFDIAVECSGNPTGLALATRIVKPLGTIVLKSTFHEKPQIDTSLWVVNEITIVGSRCGPFAPALKALESGAVDPLPLIGETFPFEKAAQAFAAAQKPGAMKVLIDFRQ